MSQSARSPYRRRWLSLSARVTLLLIFAAIIPLVITVVTSELLSRQALVDQANKAMETDANNRVQLVGRYLIERLSDTVTLSQVQSVQEFLTPPTQPLTALDQQSLILHAAYSLQAGETHDKNYSSWTLFDLTGAVKLTYPLKTVQTRGTTIVPDRYLKQVSKGTSFISDVYYNPKIQKAQVDLYSPVKVPTPENPIPNKTIGFMRATLNLDYISKIVHGEVGANGTGSYAFMLDQYGVRIDDPNPNNVFKAIAPLSSSATQIFKHEARDGSGSAPQVIADNDLSTRQSSSQPDHLFQMTPTGKSEPFQVVRDSITAVPWTYFVLSPVSTVTAVENQQLMTTAVIGVLVILSLLVIGLIVGQRITRPIMISVENLRNNTEALNTLANRQQKAASEQMWVVDSSQVGLQSVQYYTEASSVAAHSLLEITNNLVQNWNRLDPHTIHQSLEQIITAAQYIENASGLQNSSNQKLATAIKVTTQVTEQLAAGATSATDAANQLEDVVSQLRQVTGR